MLIQLGGPLKFIHLLFLSSTPSSFCLSLLIILLSFIVFLQLSAAHFSLRRIDPPSTLHLPPHSLPSQIHVFSIYSIVRSLLSLSLFLVLSL